QRIAETAQRIAASHTLALAAAEERKNAGLITAARREFPNESRRRVGSFGGETCRADGFRLTIRSRGSASAIAFAMRCNRRARSCRCDVCRRSPYYICQSNHAPSTLFASNGRITSAIATIGWSDHAHDVRAIPSSNGFRNFLMLSYSEASC